MELPDGAHVPLGALEGADVTLVPLSAVVLAGSPLEARDSSMDAPEASKLLRCSRDARVCTMLQAAETAISDQGDVPSKARASLQEPSGRDS